MFYSGESNVPGAPGNLLAGSPGYFPPEAEIQRRMQERYYQTPAGKTLIENTNKLREKIRQGNFRPSLESAYFPDAVGSSSNPMIAQAYPGGQAIGNAAALGGQVGINPQQYQQMMEMMQQGQGAGKPPVNFGIDVEDEKVKALRGNVSAQLDANQRLNFGGDYNVQDQSGRFGVGYQTPTFGFDVNVTRTPRMPGMPGAGYGAMMNMGGRF